jgi:hypothetical protein
MNHRHSSNRNLTLHTESTWDGLPVQTKCGSLIVNYLDRIRLVIKRAVKNHPRTCVFRCELSFPDNDYEPDTAVISRFIDSLKAQIKAHESRKSREGRRIHFCHLRYVWVKERDSSRVWHYHVALFVNRDAYFTLGLLKSMRSLSVNDYSESSVNDTDSTNMSDRIRLAWASALDLRLSETRGLVHFPKNPTYCLDANDRDFDEQFDDVFHRLSYFAKVKTKHFGEWSKNFGSSRS